MVFLCIFGRKYICGVLSDLFFLGNLPFFLLCLFWLPFGLNKHLPLSGVCLSDMFLFKSFCYFWEQS